MKTISVGMLAKKIGQSEEDVRSSLEHGWSTELLSLAGEVTANYVSKLMRKGKLAGVKIGRDWVVSKDAGDAWLARKGIRVE